MGVRVRALGSLKTGSGPDGFLKTGNRSLGGLETGDYYVHSLKTGNRSLDGVKTRSGPVDSAVVSNDLPRFRKVPVLQSGADEVEGGSNGAVDFLDVLNGFLDHVKIGGYCVDYLHSVRTGDDCFDFVVIGNGFAD